MEKDKILLDASFVIALYYQADPQYTEANAFFEMHADSRFYLLESTLREILTVLTYRGGSQFACTCLSDIQDAFDCVILGDDFFEELAFFRGLTTKLSFFDAALIYHSHKQNIALVSLDRELNNFYKKYFLT